MGKYIILVLRILVAAAIISSCSYSRDNQPENWKLDSPASGTAQQPAQIQSTDTPLKSPCNAAQYVNDVTIPDNTEFPPGQKFTKIWEIKNLGSCVWDSSYQAFYFSGDRLSSSDFVPLDKQKVAPNDTVTISVEMVSPDVPGTYLSYWKILTSEGHAMGIGQEGENAFYVKIIVVGSVPEK